MNLNCEFEDIDQTKKIGRYGLKYCIPGDSLLRCSTRCLIREFWLNKPLQEREKVMYLNKKLITRIKNKSYKPMF